MKTFKTITFVTATTAVVSVITLFSVEQTKVEEKFFEDDSLNRGYLEQKNAHRKEKNSRDTYAVYSKDSIQILTNSEPPNPVPDILKDTIEEEEVISR